MEEQLTEPIEEVPVIIEFIDKAKDCPCRNRNLNQCKLTNKECSITACAFVYWN